MPGKNILLIDDDRRIRRLYETFLKSSGFHVETAASGEEALDTLQGDIPDLILLDVQMQGMDGFATIKAIRSQERLMNVPVFFLTSAADPEVQNRGMELEADDYLFKTTPLPELVSRIKEALRIKAQHAKTGAAGKERGIVTNNSTLPTLLQKIAKLKRSASIHFKEMDADIYVDAGVIIHARKNHFTNLQALTRIFFESTGQFSIMYDSVPDNLPRNPLPIMTALIKISGYVDELAEEIQNQGLAGKSIKIDYELAEYNDFLPLRDTSPMTCDEMILQMPGNLKENLKKVVQGIKEGDLYPITMV